MGIPHGARLVSIRAVRSMGRRSDRRRGHHAQVARALKILCSGGVGNKGSPTETDRAWERRPGEVGGYRVGASALNAYHIIA